MRWNGPVSMGAVQITFLIVGSVLAVLPWRRIPGWLGPAVLALVALIARIVPFSTAGAAGDELANSILFLLLAVPLAVLLDRSGFFEVLADRIGAGRHMIWGLWGLAALVTIVFNLDAAVVLLTPLYVRLAERNGEDPVVFGCIPALLAALASSVLPVSNLTNLIVADRFDLGAGAFVVHLALPSIAAVLVGGVVFTRRSSAVRTVRAEGSGAPLRPARPDLDRVSALRVGIPVIVWLLAGFVIGEQIGVPAWVVVAIALVGLCIRERVVPWRHVPYQAAVLVVGLGVLAAAAARHLPVERLLSIRGLPGEVATVAALVFGANALNNLPALLVALPALDDHRERIWAVLLGANLGPTLWVTGALSTLLWQATMTRLGYTVTATRYARTAARVGVPAILAALVVHLLLVRVDG